MTLLIMDLEAFHGIIHKPSKDFNIKFSDSYALESKSEDSQFLRDWKPPLFVTTTENPSIWYPETSSDSESGTWKPPLFGTTHPWWWLPPTFSTPSTPWWWPPPTFSTKKRPSLFSTTKGPSWLPQLFGTTTRSPWLPNLFGTTHGIGSGWHGYALMGDEEARMNKDSSLSSSEVPYSVMLTLGIIASEIHFDTDFVCSPVCSLMPLGKLALGASGKTSTELLSALGLPSRDEVAPMFEKTIKELKFLQGVKLDMASAIYVAPDVNMNPQYQSQVKSVFGSEVMKLKAKDPAGAANEINKWVSTETKGMINNVIEVGQISRLTRIILVNAIYFRGTWKYKLNLIGPKTFYTQNGEQQVPFMQVKAPFKYTYSSFLKSQIVQLPYTGDEASMVIILPSTKDFELSDVEKTLKKHPDSIQKELNVATVHELDVTIPKFKIQSDVNLETVYKRLNIKTMFKSHKKNFLNMCPDEDLYVTSARQKAIIEVSEKGTEAAAASTIIIDAKSAIQNSFIANRPFYFVVIARDQQLFSGQFYASNVF